MADGGKTMRCLRAKTKGPPVSTASFPELASDPAAMSLAEVGLAKVFGTEKESHASRVMCHAERRPHSRLWG